MPVTDKQDFAILIPARYASSRFPGKPLVDLLGKPMIQRVWERCAEAVAAEQVYIATDDERIASACRDFGANVVMTGSTCLTGTDRVAEAALKLPHDFFVNVQGDEPMLDPADIVRVADAFRSGHGVVNAMTRIHDSAEFFSPNVPKVVPASDGRLLYMSRAGIPANKAGTFAIGWKQVCIYAFSREHLARFASVTEKGAIEAVEDIEILRFLDMNVEVRMVELDHTSIAVDTPEDVVRVVNALKAS